MGKKYPIIVNKLKLQYSICKIISHLTEFLVEIGKSPEPSLNMSPSMNSTSV